MKTANIKGVAYEVEDEVFNAFYEMFNDCEGFRVVLSSLLGLDYLSTNDDDILLALSKLIKKGGFMTRTVISKEEAAYDQGYTAFINGGARDGNPYPNEPERQAWFDGWDFAKGVKRNG